MSGNQLKARRATRAKAVLERGEKIFEVEPVEVRSCNGEVAKACGSFFYLGSLTDNKDSSGPEISLCVCEYSLRDYSATLFERPR